MPTRLRLSCCPLLIIVLVRTNFYSAGPLTSRQLKPAMPDVLILPKYLLLRDIAWPAQGPINANYVNDKMLGCIRLNWIMHIKWLRR